MNQFADPKTIIAALESVPVRMRATMLEQLKRIDPEAYAVVEKAIKQKAEQNSEGASK